VLESETDRLDIIRGTGGEVVRVDEVDVWAIFIDPHTPLAFGEHVLDSSEPQILARSSDLAHVNDSSVIVRAGVAYGVAGVQPDGAGMTSIRLREL